MVDNREPLTTAEILGRIQQLQEEILARQEQIASLVDSASSKEELQELMHKGEENRKVRHLERLISDWEDMIAKSRETTEDDMDLLAALVRFVGDLLVIQPDLIAERWIERVEKELDGTLV